MERDRELDTFSGMMEILTDEIIETIEEANHGVRPTSVKEFEFVLKRFGVIVLTTERVNEPVMVYNDAFSLGTLFLPVTTNEADLELWYIHECAEVCQRWEGRALFFYPPVLGTHHDIARAVEARWYVDKIETVASSP